MPRIIPSKLLIPLILVTVTGIASALDPAGITVEDQDQSDTWHYMYPDMPSTTSSSCLQLDPYGHPMICYQAVGSSPGLHFTQFDGTQWNDVLVDPGMYVGIGCQMVLSPDGFPLITYSDSYDDITLAWFDGAEWHTDTFWLEAGNGLDMAVDSTGDLHVCFTDDDDNDVHYGFWDGGSWTFEELGHATVWPVSIALDSSQNPHVAWSSAGLLQHYWKEGATWYYETTPVVYAEDMSMEFGPDGTLHVAVQGTDLYHYWRNGTGWDSETVDAMGGLDCDMAIGDDGSVHIAYDEDLNSDLRYAGNDGGGWYIEVISWAGYAGFDPSIALDSLNNPHILHSKLNWAEIVWWGADSLSIGQQTHSTLNPSITLSRNPVRSSAQIVLNILTAGDYDLHVFDISGRCRMNMLEEYLPVGEHSVNMNTADLPEGSYILLLIGEDLNCSQRFVVLGR